MYICLDCGNVFDEPKILKESHGFHDGYYESLYYCPECLGDYEEACICDKCGEIIPESESENGLCPLCSNEFEET